MANKEKNTELASNKKAFYNYEILETFEAGIVLLGTEVKSVKSHGGNIGDAYVLVSEGKVILKNASIALYKFGNLHNHEEKREKNLLLHKQEIEKLKRVSEQKGLTLIPLSLYLKGGLIKVKIGIAKGKQSHDKRAAIKEREQKQIVARVMKEGKE